MIYMTESNFRADDGKVEQPGYIVMPHKHMDKLYNSENRLVSYIHLKRLQKIIDYIIKYYKNDLQTIKVFDAGCGEGHFLELLSKYVPKDNLYGSDITPDALNEARKRGITNVYHENLKNLHFEDNFFDVVVCTEVIEHIVEFREVISELKRVIKPGGLFIITFPNEFNWTISRFLLGRKPVKVPDHVNSFTFSSMDRYMGLRRLERYCIPWNVPRFLSLTNIVVYRK